MIHEQDLADAYRTDLAASMFEEAYGCILRRYPAYSPIDYLVEQAGRVVGHVEFKGCRHPLGWYRERRLSIEVHKYEWLERVAEAWGTPGVIVYVFTDCAAWIGLVDIDTSREVTLERHDRGDALDIDRAYRVPVEALRVIR